MSGTKETMGGAQEPTSKRSRSSVVLWYHGKTKKSRSCMIFLQDGDTDEELRDRVERAKWKLAKNGFTVDGSP